MSSELSHSDSSSSGVSPRSPRCRIPSQPPPPLPSTLPPAKPPSLPSLKLPSSPQPPTAIPLSSSRASLPLPMLNLEVRRPQQYLTAEALEVMTFDDPVKNQAVTEGFEDLLKVLQCENQNDEFKSAAVPEKAPAFISPHDMKPKERENLILQINSMFCALFTEVGVLSKNFSEIPIFSRDQTDIFWPEFFHRWLIASHRLLHPLSFSALKLAIEAYCIFSNASNPFSLVAADMLHYMNTHSFDLHNSLVGKVPSSFALSKLEGVDPRPSPANLVLPSQAEFAELFLGLAAMADPQQVYLRVQDVAAQIQGIPKLNFKQGDLVVCSFPSEGSDDGSRSGCYFGRVFKVLLTPPSSLLITFDPFERSDLYIFPAEDCRLLSPKLKAILLEGGNTHQRILVDSPIKSLFSKTGDECRNRLLAFWRANEVDQAFSELFDTPGWVVTIGDWKALDNFVLKLKILRESDEAQAFLKSITAEIFQYFDALLAKLDMTKDLFLPVYNFILFEINHFRKHIHTLTPKLWDSAVITADSKLQNISDLVLDIIEGRRKRVLCEQWHKNLHNNVVAFLSALGFIHDTLPADYIRHPPVNLGQAEINLGLIRQVLDPTNDIHRVRQFLTRCIAETYQLIDPFLVEMSTVLCNQLRLDDPSSLLDLDRVTELELEITGRSRMSRRASMNPVTTSKLVNLVRDLQYLLVMKKMDAAWLESINEPEAKQQKLELSQVVPVTGLVMGRFHMFENELATALSVWLPKMKPEKLLAPRPDTRPRSGTDPFGPTRALQDVDPILPAVVESAVEEAISASPRKDRSRTALHSRGERPFSDMHQAPQDTPLKPPVRKERPLSHLEFELAECASSDSIDEFVSQAVLRGAFNPFRASGRRESKELEKHRTVIQRYLNTQPKNEPASSNSYNNSLSGPPVAHNPPKYKAPRSSSLLRTLSKKEFNPRMAPFPGVKLHDESFRQSSLFNATPVPKPDKEKPFADVASIVPSPAFRDLDAPPPPLVTATLIEELPSPNKPGSFSGSGSIPKHSSTESVPFPGVKLYIAEETRISPRVAFSKKEC